MENIESPIKKFLRFQYLATFVNYIAASAGMIYLATDYWGNTFAAYFFGLAGAWALSKILNIVSLIVLQFIFYGSNTDQLLADANEFHAESNEASGEDSGIVVNEVTLTIVEVPKTPFGKFMDADIFEWIDVKDKNDETLRLKFFGTMDITNGITQSLPEGCVLLPPGILYQDESAINKVT
jgi:uncharacterized membrane protein